MTGLSGLLLPFLGKGKVRLRGREGVQWLVACRGRVDTGVDAEVRIGAKVNSLPKLTLASIALSRSKDNLGEWLDQVEASHAWCSTRWMRWMVGGMVCACYHRKPPTRLIRSVHARP